MIEEYKKIAQVALRSGFFQLMSEDQAVVIMIAGSEYGFSPIQSLLGINVIRGNITLSGAALASVARRGGKYEWAVIEDTEQVCRLEFFRREGSVKDSLGESSFTFDEARAAGLVAKKGNNWNKWRRDMLYWRAVSRGVRRFCSDQFGGAVYLHEEIKDDTLEKIERMAAKESYDVLALNEREQPGLLQKYADRISGGDV